jgi:hypothetical protein
MKLSTTAKGVLGIMAVAGAYRLYQLWKTGNALSYGVKNVKFKRIEGRFAVVVGFDIFNPTANSISLKKVTGKLNSGNYTLSNFQSGAFQIKPGHNVVPITFYLDSLNIVSFITNAITSKQFPIFTVETTSHLALFNYTDKFSINTADYAGELQAVVFTDKK